MKLFAQEDSMELGLSVKAVFRARMGALDPRGAWSPWGTVCM